MDEVISRLNVSPHFTEPAQDDLLEQLNDLVYYQEEPFASSSIFAQWSVFRLVHKQGVKVMLDGQGADEQLAGYISLIHYYFQELKQTSKIQGVWEQLCAVWRLGFKQMPFVKSIKQRLSTGIVYNSWLKFDTAILADESHYLAVQKEKPFGNKYSLKNILYQLTHLNNLQSLLKYQDRNSMAFSVESRVPFLDYRLVEFISSLPSQFLISNGYTKRVLRDAMRGIIPGKVRKRVSKLGFATPENLWMNGCLQPLIKEAICSEELSPYLDKDKAYDFYKQVCSKKQQDSSPWRWVSYYLWRKMNEL